MEENKTYIGLILDENNVIKSWCLPADCCEVQGNIDTSKIICGLSKFINDELVNPSESEIEAWKQQQEEKNRLNELRGKRNILLKAFDIWEKAVLRGREDNDTSIMQWYQDLLDLKEGALTNIPDVIKYYL